MNRFWTIYFSNTNKKTDSALCSKAFSSRKITQPQLIYNIYIYLSSNDFGTTTTNNNNDVDFNQILTFTFNYGSQDDIEHETAKFHRDTTHLSENLNLTSVNMYHLFG